MSFRRKKKLEFNFQQVGDLVTRNISVFCSLRVALYFKDMPHSIGFYKSNFLHVIPAHVIVPWYDKYLKQYYLYSCKKWTIQRHILYFWQNFVKLCMHKQQQKFLFAANFADSTPKLKDLELNLKVFCTFLSDIYIWFNNAALLFSSFILHVFKGPLFILNNLYCNHLKCKFYIEHCNNTGKNKQINIINKLR